MPSLFLTMFMIDHPLFGRKNSLVIFFLAAGIFHLIFGLTAVTIIGSVARFFMKDVFQVIYPLTTESFETRIRTKGFGFCSGFGRVGAILMPFILIPLDEWKQSSVYVIFAVISGIAGLIAWKMILETMNKNLDKTKESKLMGVMSNYEAD
jgi:MFS transporter, putative metabolite:H+ symporter